MAVAAPLASRQNHSYSSNLANTKQAQLTTAYQQLARELASDQIKVVGTYTLGKVIGEGTFGSVHIASHRLTGTRCAIKKIPKSATPMLTREIHHHRRLHHPHIVHLHEIIATESHIWLVSELCSGGELFDYLVERGRILEGEARRLFGELCSAVGWLHQQGVVHRDLKLENVLLDGEMRVKLGDLGFAREYTKGRLMDTFCGTTGYASPEMLACKKYLGVETDIWSLGIILYTLLCGGLPFDHDDERVMKDLIMKGEYEEPEWLTEEARSLIAGILKQDPAERLTMEGILTHPWFKMTLYDNIHEATSTDNPRSVPSVPPSPLPGSSSSDAVQKLFSSSASATSFPFSPRSARPSVSLDRIPPPADPESEPSETSFEFTDPLPKSTSGDTSPTTAENDDEPDLKKRNHSGEFSKTELALELAHLNSSQSTIKNLGSFGGDSPASLRARMAKRATLEVQKEDGEESTTSRADKRLSSSSLTVIDEHAVTLPVADHSRTPVRTKRRSLTSQLPLERRLSHQSTSSQWQAFYPEDFQALMNDDRPPLFSTPSEKALLNRLSDLGFDTGQLIHSVMHDACDTSAAMWWILRLKQVERGETDDVVQARQASAAKRRERAQRRAREKLEARSTASNVVLNESTEGPTLNIPPPEPVSRPKTPDGDFASVTSTNSTLHVPAAPREGPIIGLSPPPSPRGGRRSPSGTSDMSPSKDKDKEAQLRKARSPSMNMLQRATSVLVLGVKNHKDHKEERLTPEPQEQHGHKRGDSPTKNKLALPKKSGEGDSPIPTGARTPDTSPSRENSTQTPPPADAVASAEKVPKKDSIWATFRHLFNDTDRRRGKKQNVVASKPPPVIPTRSTGVRPTGMSRTSQPSSSRRTSFDGRPLYSHRSSSVNSRRSSIASNHIAEYTINLHDVGLNSGLLRRASGRSQRSHRSDAGSQTPTSDREYSRPGSSNSFRGGRSRRSSLRSPPMSSDGTRLRSGPPASPLHDYHRRSASGSASTRVRHIRVIHEAKALRPSSVASSVRSNPSSRASSMDLTRDSDYDTGREDSGTPSRSNSLQFSERGLAHLALHNRSRQSGLSRGLKPPLRDVFQKNPDDEWESEDEDGTFAGGLGQAKGQQYGSGSNVHAAAHPGATASPVASRFNTSVTSSRFSRGEGDRHGGGTGGGGASGSGGASGGASNNAAASSMAGLGFGHAPAKKGESSGSGGSRSGRRGGLPSARNQAPVIEEEEEEEE